jgi:hypothetical protein
LYEGDAGDRYLNSFNVIDVAMDSSGAPLQYDLSFWGWSSSGRGYWHKTGAIYRAASNGHLTWPVRSPRRAANASSGAKETMRLPEAVKSPSTARDRLQRFIAEKTEGFIGRDYVFDGIDRFLATEQSGYVIVEGDPGMGKSAILAEFVRRTKCIAHFNVRSQGVTTSAHFIESVHAQIAARFDLPIASIPADAARDGSFFQQVVEEASARLAPGAKLVIAIDALDEVDDNHVTDANILFLPESPPRGVFFLLTQRQRRHHPVPLLTSAPCQKISLFEYGEASARDVRTYLVRALQRGGVRRWVKDKDVSDEAFVDTLTRKSENNFMYLRYTVSDIERGLYSDLSIDGLPKGLEGYYGDHWRRMGMMEKPLPRSKLRIVYVLCEVQRPVSRDLIREFASEDAVTVQEVLDDWDQFLREDRTVTPTRYSIYHASFRDFLQSKPVVEAAGLTLSEINGLIGRNLLQGLLNDAPGA